MHTTPRPWGWRWARLALLGLLLAGWECPGDDSDDDDDHGGGNGSNALPLAFVDHPYEYRFEIPVGNAPYTIDQVVSEPDWLQFVSTDGWSVTFSGTPSATGEHLVGLFVRDEDNAVHGLSLDLRVLETNALALTGMWTLGVDVWTANSVCAGEENDTPSSDPAYIHQTGQDILLAGIGGDMGETLHGYLFPGAPAYLAEVRLWGSVSEDGGSTEIQYRLDVVDWQTMSGMETWSWQGASQSCQGTSGITLARVP